MSKKYKSEHPYYCFDYDGKEILVSPYLLRQVEIGDNRTREMELEIGKEYNMDVLIGEQKWIDLTNKGRWMNKKDFKGHFRAKLTGKNW